MNVNPLADWTTQAEDPYALGTEVVQQRAANGEGEAQFSQGCLLVDRADGNAGFMGASGRSPEADEGTALLEKAAGQGHVYAMDTLGDLHDTRKEHEHAVAWFTKAAEAGLPKAMHNLGVYLDEGKGVAAPDHPAAAGWYRRAADAGHGPAANNLCRMYNVGRGVTRSKRRAMQWRRKAAENGHAKACLQLAGRMYGDEPYAREVGHVGEAAGLATSAGVTVGHDVPPDVLAGVMHWLQKGCATGQQDPLAGLDAFRRDSLKGNMYCHNEGCKVVGLLKEFKVCPQCKTIRYCGAECQKQDWTTGGHKEKCGTFAH